jgi:hypothetical protein
MKRFLTSRPVFFGGALLIGLLVLLLAQRFAPPDLVGFASPGQVALSAVTFVIGSALGGLVMIRVALFFSS